MPDALAAPSFTPASGIEYRTIAGIPGTYFDCAPLRATMSTAACARSWSESQSTDNCKCLSCKGCAVGESHSGREPATVVPSAAPAVVWRCCHCGISPTTRLVGGTYCVSCYNRRRELLIGRNGKGKFPDMIGAELHPAWAVVARTPGVDAQAVSRTPHGTTEDWQRPVLTAVFTPKSALGASASFFRIANGKILVWCVVANEAEMQRVIAKRLPGHRVERIEIEPDFNEFRRAELDPSWWLRELAPKA